MTFYRLITGFIGRQRRAYGLAAAMLASISVLTVSVPRRVGKIVDGLVAHRLDQNALLIELGWLVAIGIAIYFMRVGWRLQLFKAAYQLGVELRTRLYACLSAQGPAFYQQQRTGNLMALATNDIDAIEMVAGEAMLAGFDGSLTLLLVLASMLFGVDWRLTLVALLPFPFMAFAFWRISTRVHAASADALSRFGDLNVQVQESLAGIRGVRALGLEARSAAQFASLAQDASEANFQAQRWEAAYEPAVGVTLAAAAGLTLAVGGYLVWTSALTIGALTSFSMYLSQLIWPMFAAGWVLSLIERGRAAWARLAPILTAQASITDDGGIAAAPTGVLLLETVTFAYPGQAIPALAEISLRLEAGMTLGLVGPTGSGKSTLLRLLLRQYAPQQGAAHWGAHALSAYRLSSLRAAIRWVPQEAFLFSATIFDNIVLARPDATPDEVVHVARIAAIHDDIQRFPQGYQTMVGERGITLSGGQRQRIALARALLAASDLLLLDDALSAVDTLTENQILGHLRATRGPGTASESPASAQISRRRAIIASHRLSAVADADWIVVLRAGRINASGTHAALLEQDGWYAAQWRYQQLEASLDAL